MRTLRFYWIEKDGHIHHPPQEIECLDNADARDKARDIAKDGEPGRSLEVWDRARCLGKFAASADHAYEIAPLHQQQTPSVPKNAQALKFGLAPHLRYILHAAA